MILKQTTLAVAVTLLSGVLVVEPATAQRRVRVLAVEGDTIPGTGEEFFGFSSPKINGAGQIVFQGSSGPSDSGLFVANLKSITTVMREGDPFEGGFLSRPGQFALNESGSIAFTSPILGKKVPVPSAVFLASPDGNITSVARAGQPAPDGDGNFTLVAYGPLNDSGQLALLARLDVASGGGSQNEYAAYRVAPDGTYERIGRTGDAVSGSALPFDQAAFVDMSMNASGDVAFRGSMMQTGVPASFTRTFFRADPTTGNLEKIVGSGDPTPDGPGQFFVSGIIVPPGTLSSGFIAINDSGQVVFRSFINEFDEVGIYRQEPDRSLHRVARTGVPSPDGDGIFLNLGRAALNDRGETVFVAELSDTVSPEDNTGVFRDLDGVLSTIVREGDPTPTGNGVFADFYAPGLFPPGGPNPLMVLNNDEGQLAFHMSLKETAGGFVDNEGIFFYDDNDGLVEIIREGDPFLGSTIRDFSLSREVALGDYGSGLNNLGDVAFWFELNDLRTGVAVWTVPEPVNWAVCIWCGLFLFVLKSCSGESTSGDDGR